jgi:hypothetical protein
MIPLLYLIVPTLILCLFGVNSAMELVLLETVMLFMTNCVNDLLTWRKMVDNVTVLCISLDTQFEWKNYII